MLMVYAIIMYLHSGKQRLWREKGASGSACWRQAGLGALFLLGWLAGERALQPEETNIRGPLGSAHEARSPPKRWLTLKGSPGLGMLRETPGFLRPFPYHVCMKYTGITLPKKGLVEMTRQTVRQFALSATMIIGLFLSGILSPQAATADTYYVATDGNDADPGTEERPFQTIRQGLSILSAGDTLYIRGGTYTEGIDSNYQRIPTGTSWSDAPLIASFPEEMVVLAPGGGGDIINLPNASDHYIAFDGLVVDGTGASGSVLSIGAVGAHHIRFQNMDMKNSYGSIVWLWGSDIEVINSKISGSQNAYGVYMVGHNNVVDGNEIYNNAGYAIHIYDGRFPNPSTDDHIVSNNIMYNNGFGRSTAAITVGKGSNCLVQNNVIYDNFGGIDVYKDGTNEQIDHNTLRNNGWGIAIFESSTEAIIKDNILDQNGTTIDDRGVGTTVENNTIIE
jgi:parallel beta-helix repeat protein